MLRGENPIQNIWKSKKQFYTSGRYALSDLFPSENLVPETTRLTETNLRRTLGILLHDLYIREFNKILLYLHDILDP